MSDLPGHDLPIPDLEDEVAVSRWAFALPPLERDRLLLATSSVLAAEDLRARPRARALLDALLPALAASAEPSTRREAAHRLSLAPWAPEAAARLHTAAGPDVAPGLAARFGLPRPPVAPETPEADVRLVDKLQRAGRLTPAYAVGALRRGRPGVFGQAVARLADLPPETVAAALRDEIPADLALACAAASLDRAVFPTVLAEARALRGDSIDTGEDRLPLSAEVRAAFDRGPDDAARALRAAAGRRASRWDASRAPS